MPQVNHYTAMSYKSNFKDFNSKSIYNDDLINSSEIKVLDYDDFDSTLKFLKDKNPFMIIYLKK